MLRNRRVLVLVGSGDNGGDALFAAAGLTSLAEVRLLLVSDRFHEEGLAAATAAGAELGRAARGARRGIRIRRRRRRHPGYRVVRVVGAAGDRSRGRDEALLPAVHSGRPRVVAVDLPSGLHPDTGEADDVVLPAAVTVTFGAVKAGIASGRGPVLCGKIVLVDLGLHDGLAAEVPAGEASVDRVLRG